MTGEGFESSLRSVLAPDPHRNPIDFLEANVKRIPYSPKVGPFRIEATPHLREPLEALADPTVDIGTVCARVGSEHEKTDPAVVKPVVAFAEGKTIARAYYFSRATVPAREGPIYHHIGLYAYRRDALKRFISLPQGLLEKREGLEQLRALENNMRIDVALVDTVPLGVDTPGDLERARLLLMPR